MVALAQVEHNGLILQSVDVTPLVAFSSSSARIGITEEGVVRVVQGSGPASVQVAVTIQATGLNLPVQPMTVSISEEEVAPMITLSLALSLRSLCLAEFCRGLPRGSHKASPV